MVKHPVMVPLANSLVCSLIDLAHTKKCLVLQFNKDSRTLLLLKTGVHSRSVFDNCPGLVHSMP